MTIKILIFINFKINNIITMANLSSLNTIISDLFGVLGTLINNVVNLITGDLLVLAVVGGFVSLILGVIALVYKSIKGYISQNVRMR